MPNDQNRTGCASPELPRPAEVVRVAGDPRAVPVSGDPRAVRAPERTASAGVILTPYIITIVYLYM
jgi:hypothetical protein